MHVKTLLRLSQDAVLIPFSTLHGMEGLRYKRMRATQGLGYRDGLCGFRYLLHVIVTFLSDFHARIASTSSWERVEVQYAFAFRVLGTTPKLTAGMGTSLARSETFAQQPAPVQPITPTRVPEVSRCPSAKFWPRSDRGFQASGLSESY